MTQYFDQTPDASARLALELIAISRRDGSAGERVSAMLEALSTFNAPPRIMILVLCAALVRLSDGEKQDVLE